jgi:DNA-binding FadR family transcriptional regulator
VPDHAAVYEAIAASDDEGARNSMSELLRLALSDMKIAPKP